MNHRRLWIAFAGVILVSFAVLGWVGGRIYQLAPPIPERVVTTDGQTLLEPGEISAGQNVWQSLGGMESGSVWGHGSYVAPDWSADWLHRECTSSSTTGRAARTAGPMTGCRRSARRPCASASSA